MQEIQHVADFQDVFAQDLKAFKQLSIAEDTKIKPGGCLVETKLGFIDSSISTKLDVILKALIAAYEQRMIDHE